MKSRLASLERWRCGRLRKWLATLDGRTALGPDAVDRVWNELSARVQDRDRYDAQRAEPPKPTLARIVRGTTREAPAGPLVAMHGVANPVTRSLGAWAYAIAVLAGIAIGIRLRRIRHLPWFASGLLLGYLASAAILAVITIRLLAL